MFDRSVEVTVLVESISVFDENAAQPTSFFSEQHESFLEVV